MEVSPALSLLSSVDLYWKSQLLVEYSNYLHTEMILDDMQQEEGYLFHGGVIYHHGRIFLFRDFKLKKKILKRVMFQPYVLHEDLQHHHEEL